MNTKHVAVAMMSVSLSTVGCLSMPSDAEIEAMEIERVGYAPQDNPTGGGTTNDLVPESFHANKYKLLTAMGSALTSGSHGVSSGILGSGILSSAEGRAVFKKAIECALPEGQYVTHTTGSLYSGITITSYYGQGLMKTTGGWYSAALTTSQKEDVLRCVVARINMDGVEVPIVLSGQNVADKAGESHDGVSPDALWDVKLVTTAVGTSMQITVWPLASIGGSSDGSVSQCNFIDQDMVDRVCDDDPANCGLNVSQNAEDDCYHYTSATNPEGYYRCGSGGYRGITRPVVQSWATESYVFSFYPGCYPALAPAEGMNWEQIPYGP